MNGKGLICFIVGGAVGFGSGYILLNRKYNQRFDDEIADLRDTYKRELKSIREERAKLKGEPCIDARENKEEKPVNILEAADRSEKDLCRYSSITREYVSENNEKPTFKPEDHPEEIDEDLPYVITIDDFLEDPNFEKQTVGYYPDEDIFVDETERLIEGMQGMDLGMRNLESWNDHGIVYIRKPSNMTDYEVMKEIGSFYDGDSDDGAMFSIGGDPR